MLQRQFRLPHSVHLSRPSIFNTQYFSLRYSHNNLSLGRYGFVVSKKIDKRAVVRNRIKRIVRSCIEKEWINQVKGYDMLFLLKKQCVEASTADVCAAINVILTRIKK